jgi:hypothetical protein
MKTCQAPDCDNLIDQDRRSDSIYCSNACKRRAMRARKRNRKTSNFLHSFGTGFESRESEGGHLADTSAADTRFKAMIAADEASRVPDLQLQEWAAWERRNPGVAHPGRTAARMAHGQQARLDDWHRGTDRFSRPQNSIAEQARRARGQQRRPITQDDDNAWNDPELADTPSMIDAGNFRRGRKF